MRAGRLDRRITIQRQTTTFSDSGASVETWSAISHRRPASRTPIRGDERFQAQQFVAREQVEFRVRYGSSVTGLSPLDRLVYPAPADPDEQAPSDQDIYDIMAVHEIGRREGFRILAARRAESAG
jgi:head-tail adaptor